MASPTKQQNIYKRIFPKRDKCYCCCCFNFETAVKFSTIILMILIGFSMTEQSKTIPLLFNIIFFISHILLFIGLFTKIIPLMKQYKPVFAIFVVYFLLNKIGICLFELINDGTFYFGGYEIYKSGGRSQLLIFYFSAIVIITSLLIYYYICICIYIEDVKEEIFYRHQAKSIEENVR